MAKNNVPKKRRKGYFAGQRWAFNAEVRNTLVAWMRKLRARVWVVAPLVALAFGVDKRPELVAWIVVIVVIVSALLQVLVASFTDEPDTEVQGSNDKKRVPERVAEATPGGPSDPPKQPSHCNSEQKE